MKRYGQRYTEQEKMRNLFMRRRRKTDVCAYLRAVKMGVEAVFVSRDELLERDGDNCYLCGGWMSIHDMSFEHVVPITRGGAHKPDNLKLAHMRCNARKSTRLVEEIGDLSSWEHGGTVPPLTCHVCGKLYEVKPRERARSKCCSKACRIQYTQKKVVEAKLKRRVVVTCESCGKSEPVRPSRVATFRFCSPACRGAWQKTQKPNFKGGKRQKICPTCQEPFPVYPNSKREFCSQKCASARHSLFMAEYHKRKQGELSAA